MAFPFQSIEYSPNYSINYEFLKNCSCVISKLCETAVASAQLRLHLRRWFTYHSFRQSILFACPSTCLSSETSTGASQSKSEAEAGAQRVFSCMQVRVHTRAFTAGVYPNIFITRTAPTVHLHEIGMCPHQRSNKKTRGLLTSRYPSMCDIVAHVGYDDSGSIARSPLPGISGHGEGLRVPLTLNDRGLRLSLPLIKIDENIVAVLGCAYVTKKDQLIGLHLADVSVKGGRYI